MMTFSEAITHIISGKMLTKDEWKNPAEYILMKDEFLCIHHANEDENTFHRLLVSKGDMVGTDWMLIEEAEYVKN